MNFFYYFVSPNMHARNPSTNNGIRSYQTGGGIAPLYRTVVAPWHFGLLPPTSILIGSVSAPSEIVIKPTCR